MTKVKRTSESNGLPRDSLGVSQSLFNRGSIETFETQPAQPTEETIQFTELEFRAFLATLAKQAGNKAELAPRLGVSAQFLGDVIAGRKHAGPKLLNQLGASVERVYTITVEAETNGHEPQP